MFATIDIDNLVIRGQREQVFDFIEFVDHLVDFDFLAAHVLFVLAAEEQSAFVGQDQAEEFTGTDSLVPTASFGTLEKLKFVRSFFLSAGSEAHAHDLFIRADKHGVMVSRVYLGCTNLFSAFNR